MKAALVLVGVFALIGASTANTYGRKLDLDAVPYEQRMFEDVINATINQVVGLLARFDPVQIAHKEIALLGHHAEVLSVNAEGFSNVVASHIKLSGLLTWTLELDIEAPRSLNSIENWKVLGDVFFGDGAARLEINDLKIKIRAKINPLSVELKDLLISPSIGHADVSITGLYNNEELSKLVSDVCNKFLNDFLNNPEVHKKFSKIVLVTINTIIGIILGIL